jgi:hypothetical protein
MLSVSCIVIKLINIINLSATGHEFACGAKERKTRYQSGAIKLFRVWGSQLINIICTFSIDVAYVTTIITFCTARYIFIKL